MEIILGGCTKTHDTKLVPICTNLSLTVSWYKYVLVSIPQEAGTHMYSTNLYLTRSLYKKVQISLSQEAGTNMYKSLINREPVLICMYKPLSRRKLVQICTNLSLAGSQYKYVQISLSSKSKLFAPALLSNGVLIFTGIFS